MRRVGSAMQIIFRFFPCFPLFKYSTGKSVYLFFTVFPVQVNSGISSYFYGIIIFQHHPPVSIPVSIPIAFFSPGSYGKKLRIVEEAVLHYTIDC